MCSLTWIAMPMLRVRSTIGEPRSPQYDHDLDETVFENRRANAAVRVAPNSSCLLCTDQTVEDQGRLRIREQPLLSQTLRHGDNIQTWLSVDKRLCHYLLVMYAPSLLPGVVGPPTPDDVVPTPSAATSAHYSILIQRTEYGCSTTQTHWIPA